VQPWFQAVLLGLWITGTLLSGFYPALVLSSFKPVTVLKGKLKNSAGGIVLRKGLVIAQFMASIALISGTFIVYRQLHYMMSSDLGMNIDQVLVVERPGIAPGSMNRGAFDRNTFNAAIDLFHDELKKDPAIEAVSASGNIPGKQREYKGTIRRNNSADSIVMWYNSMDYDFFDVFKMHLIAGRNFSRDFPKDPDTSVIITETAARLLGFRKPEEAIGKTLSGGDFGNWKPVITGVVNDYHQVSLKKPLEPTLFTCSPYEGEFYSMRIRESAGRLPQTLKHIEACWTRAFPGNPFEYFFLDDYFNKQYQNERQFGKLFTCFAALAIIISCLGLFGLSAYTASQRIKEIGIRKVLGASVMNITTMLSKDFLRLVAIAILIATPIAWFIMHKWLQGFAYRIDISWWIFAVAGIIALLIALLTVSFQAIKAAITNPVKSLRSE
jgi:putative ABC transport system permease protein